MPSLARSRKSEKGAELVEFALTLLPTFGLLFLIVNVAWVIFARACLQEAVREGVRYAITGQTLSGMSGMDDSIQTVVQQHSFGMIPDPGCVSVQFFSPSNLSSPVSNPVAGDVVQVSISNVDVKPLAPLLISSAALPLSASASDIMQGSSDGHALVPGTPLTCSSP